MSSITFTGQVDSNSNTASHSVVVDNIPNVAGTRLFVLVHLLQSFSTWVPEATITSATLNGIAMTEVANVPHQSSNRNYRAVLFEVIDPRQGGAAPSSQTVSVTASATIRSFGISVCIATGVSDRSAPVSSSQNGTNHRIAVTPSQLPAELFVASHIRHHTASGGVMNTRDSATASANLNELVRYRTGTTNTGVDLALFAGHIEAASLSAETIGWTIPSSIASSGHGATIAFALYSAAPIGIGYGYGVDPDVQLSSATLDDLRGVAYGYGSVGEIVLGSIPPVQVRAEGSLYLSTAARNLTVMLLVTGGDNWVIVDSGGDPENLSAIITRRPGYLTLQ